MIVLLGEHPRCETYSSEAEVEKAIQELTAGRALLDVRLFLFHGRQLAFKPTTFGKADVVVERLAGGDMVISNSPSGSDLKSTGEIVVLPGSATNDSGESTTAGEADDDISFAW